MGRHSGKISKCKFGANFIGGMRTIEWTNTVDTVDTTAAGDVATSHVPTFESWSGSCDGLLDHADTAQAAIGVGDSLALEFYSEGDASGKVYYSGTATITEIAFGVPHSSEATVKYSLQGQGALSGPTTVV